LSTTNLVNLIAFIATALQMVETCAYLLVVTCLGHTLSDDTGPQASGADSSGSADDDFEASVAGV